MSIQLGIMLGMPFWTAGAATGTAYTAQLREFSRDRAVFDSGAHLARAVADVPLSGTTDAPDGQVIEVRAVSLDDGGATSTGWVAVSTTAGGAWFGTLPVPRSSSWFRAEVRVRGSTAPAGQTANRFGAGHVWSFWGQSQPERLATFDSSLSAYRVPVTHPGNVQIVRRTGVDTAEVIDITNPHTANMSPAFIDIANAFNAVRPGEKLMILWHTVSGSNPYDALTTIAEKANTGYLGLARSGLRQWETVLAVHDLGCADGQKPGLLTICDWTAWDGTDAAVNRLMRLYAGHDRFGVATTPAEEQVPRLFPIAHGGIYDMGYTRLSWSGPGSFDGIGIDTAASTVADESFYTIKGPDGFSRKYEDLRDIYGSEANPETLSWAWTENGIWHGDSDRSHYHPGPDGRQRYARLLTHMCLQATGLAGYALPELDYRYDDPAGAYVDFGISGRNLTTERKRRVAAGTLGNLAATLPSLADHGAAIDPADDHRTEVMGWYVNGLPAKRAEIVEGAGPGGEDIVRVRPNGDPFTYADKVVYGLYGGQGFFVYEDFTDQTWADGLVVDMGQPAALLPALPVHLQCFDALPTTLVRPASFTVTGTTRFVDTANLGSGVTKLRIEIRAAFKPDVTSGIASIGGSNNFDINRWSNGGISTDVYGHVTDADTGAGATISDKMHTVVIAMNRATGTGTEIVTYVDGVELNRASSSTGDSNFSASSRLVLLSLGSFASPTKAEIEHIKVWKNDIDGTGTPYKTIQGDAATVNADSWLNGAPAV